MAFGWPATFARAAGETEYVRLGQGPRVLFAYVLVEELSSRFVVLSLLRCFICLLSSGNLDEIPAFQALAGAGIPNADRTTQTQGRPQTAQLYQSFGPDEGDSGREVKARQSRKVTDIFYLAPVLWCLRFCASPNSTPSDTGANGVHGHHSTGEPRLLWPRVGPL